MSTEKALDLIKLAQSGDSSAFGEFYDLYIQKIYNFIYYKTHHRETAEDLTSQVFIKALEKINTFQGEYISAWLYAIARNTVIDHYRTQKKNANIEDIFDLAESDDFVVDLDVKNKLEQVKEYLAKLKSTQREIITLRLWENLSYQELAEITGKSESNCKVIFSRAMKKLRQEMPLAAWLLLLLGV